MHLSNMKFWEHCASIYPQYFGDSSVLELGSKYVNGTVRDVFICDDYVGVDWESGPCVDRVSKVHELDIETQFDAVVSASMLEHDPFWEQSITKMVELLKQDGVLILSWGAALNAPHCYDVSPDGGFHNLKAGLVLDLLKRLGIYIHIFKYEANLLYAKDIKKRAGDGWGEVCLVAFKNPACAIGQADIDALIPEDMVEAI